MAAAYYAAHVAPQYSSPLQLSAAPTNQFAAATLQKVTIAPQWSPLPYSRPDSPPRCIQPYVERSPTNWTTAAASPQWSPQQYNRTASPHRPTQSYNESAPAYWTNAAQPYRRTDSPHRSEAIQPYRRTASPHRALQSQPHTDQFHSTHGSNGLQGVHDFSRRDIVGFLEIGEVADLPAPRLRTHGAIVVTIESSSNPNAFIDVVGPLALSLQRASECFHTDGEVSPIELSPNPQQLTGNLRNQSRQPEHLQVMQIRLRVHFCSPNLNIDHRDGLRDVSFVGATDAIAVSWHADRKVYDLKTPVGSVIGHIYLAHRLCFSSDIQRSLEEQSDESPVTEVEWGSKTRTKLKIFSRSYVMKLSLPELSDNAHRVYKALKSDSDFGRKNVPRWDKIPYPAEPSHHYDELIQWTLDVQRTFLDPILKVTGKAKPTHRIKIKIISARGLKAANLGTFQDGLSDPYVVAEIVGRKDSRFPTKVIDKNLNPTWNEEYETDCCIGVDKLQFAVFDKAEGVLEQLSGAKDTLLGIATLESKKIKTNGFEEELTLKDEKGKHEGILRISIDIVKTLAAAGGSRKGSKETTHLDHHGSRRTSKDLPNADHYSSADSRHSPRNTALHDWHQHDSPQNSVYSHAPVYNHGGNATLKISICGLRNLSGGPGMQASSSGTCLCEVRGSPNSRHEARLGTQATDFDIPGYAGDGPLDFSVFSNQRELLGTGSLCAVQFFPRGYDAEMTLTCQRRGITGLLRVKIVVIGAQTSGNRSYHASPGQHLSPGGHIPSHASPGGHQHLSPHLPPGGPSNFRQNGTSRKIGIMGQSEIETIERTSQGYGNGPYGGQGYGNDTYGKQSEFMSRHLSMAEGRHPTMVDRESFAMPDARQSFAPISSIDTRGGHHQMSEMRSQNSHRDTHQQRGIDSFMEIGPSSSVYEGEPRHHSTHRRDPYEEQQQAMPSMHKEKSHSGKEKSNSFVERGMDILGSMKGVIDRSASFLSNSSSKHEKGNADGSRGSPRSMLGGGGSRSRDFDLVGSHHGGGDRAVITVHIISASGLRKADFMGLSDPYCKVSIPGKPTCAFQTDYVKQDLNPVWNAKFEIADYETTDSLHFELWDWDLVTSHDFLGRAILDPAIEPFGFMGFEGELLLEEAGDTQGKAKLKIRVESSLQEAPL